MKNLKYFVLLVAVFAIGIYAQDARTRAYIHAMLEDSAAVMRGTVHDTADAVRSAVRDTANSLWADSAAVMRAEMTDSAEDVWVDSAVILRAEMTDSAEDVWVDSAVILRAEMTDSANDVWNDSLPAALGYVGDTANVLRGEMIDSARVPLVGDWAAGDYDITGLERVEADTVEGGVVYTLKITTGAVQGMLDITEVSYINTGDVTTDSIYAREVFVKDSLYIPQADVVPATGTAGLFLADSSHDTLVAFIGGTRAVVYPASGSGIAANVVRDTVNAWWGDTADVVVLVDGTNPLTANWAAGEFDITGLEKVDAETVMVRTFISANAVPITVDSVDAQHVVSDVFVQTDSIQANHMTLVGDQILWATFRDTSTVVFNDSIAVVKVPRTLVWYYDGDVATGTQFGMTYIPEQALTVNDIKLHVETAPVGASLIVDINEAGTTIFSTNPEIDAAATREDDNHAISDATIAAGAEVTLDIDQIGSSTAGASLTVILECEQATVR